MLLVRRPYYQYSNLIKLSSTGGVRRFDAHERYIASHNNPNVKTYPDFLINRWLNKYEFKQVYSETGYKYIRDNFVRHNPYFENLLVNKYTLPKMEDDDQLVRDISNLRLWDFIKECIQTKPRKPEHHIVHATAWSLVVVVLAVFPLFIWEVPNTDKWIVALEPERQYEYPVDVIQKEFTILNKDIMQLENKLKTKLHEERFKVQ